MTKLVRFLIWTVSLFTFWTVGVYTKICIVEQTQRTFLANFILLPLPLYAAIVFATYCAWSVIYPTLKWEDKVEASEELKKEIVEAQQELSKLGLKLD